MQFMRNANKKNWLVIYLILLTLIYFIFLIWEYDKYPYDRNLQVIEQAAEIAGTSEQLDGIIIGGSNSLFGYSAEILSRERNENWLNISILHEGFSDENYNSFILRHLSTEARQSVKTVIYSSLNFNRSGRIDGRRKSKRNLAGMKRFDLYPSRNLAAYAKDAIFKSEPEMRSIYPQRTPFGDIEFTKFRCSSEVFESEFHREEIEEVKPWLIRRLSSLNAFFPNANILIAIPGEFIPADDRIAVDRRFYGELENIVEQYNMSSDRNNSLIDNGFFMGSQDICDSNHHASQVGREKQTRRVISFMKAHPR